MDNISLSILIPTRNRSAFLTRLLHYYSEVNFRHKIYIGDSSSAEHIEPTRSIIKALKTKLQVFHFEYPGLNNAQAVHNLLDSISTPYAVLLPDDDFLVPRSLELCVSFLENHSDYSAAHGVAVLFSLKTTGAFGPFLWAVRYWQRAVEGDTGVNRILDHLAAYSVTLFSVHRTETMRAMYEHVSAITDKTFALELLPCCLSVILGKVKELECLYLVRQGHGERYALPDVYDWLTSPDWFHSYEIFRDCLSEALAQQDGIGTDKARKVVKQAFWSYLAKVLTHKWQAHYKTVDSVPRPRWRELARRVPGLPNMWHKFRSAIANGGYEMSLPALLHPSSPYHADFMPIYRVVNEAPPYLSGQER